MQELSETPTDDGLLGRVSDEDRDAAIRILRALIAAMREPTPEIIAAWDIFDPTPLPPEWHTNENCARRDWQNMIDAALK